MTCSNEIDFNTAISTLKYHSPLNFDKTYFIQFSNKSTCTSYTQIAYKDKQIRTVNETKFLQLFINNNLSWKTHMECIKSKLSSACYAVRSVKPFLTINTFKMIYYSYFHSVMNYGLLFWGNFPDSIKIFRLQKKIIRIMAKSPERGNEMGHKRGS
jgi:hypothetical protein